MFHFQIPPSFSFPPVFSFLAFLLHACCSVVCCLFLSFVTTPCSLIVANCSWLTHYSLLPVASRLLHNIYCLPLHHSEVCILSFFFSLSLSFLCFSLLLNLFSLKMAHEKCVTNWNAFSFIPTKICNTIRTKKLE